MGLALFIAWLKTVAFLGGETRRLRPLRKTSEQREAHDSAAHFWAKIFAVNFAVGVVTGIPMEFQFGTNWAAFSNYSGGVIGQTLALEGVFAFFAESAFLGIFLAGAARVGQRLHWVSALMVFAGSWVSGFFIIATNAWMQHPVGYSVEDGRAQLDSLGDLLTNAWLPWQYAHNMSGAAVTGAFVLAALGAYYMLSERHLEFARTCLTVGVVGALIFTTLQIFPTGDEHARRVARYQPSSFAAAEGLFPTQKGAPLVIIGNPDTEQRRLESTIEMPHFLSFLTSRRWDATTTGLNDIPEDRWLARPRARAAPPDRRSAVARRMRHGVLAVLRGARDGLRGGARQRRARGAARSGRLLPPTALLDPQLVRAARGAVRAGRARHARRELPGRAGRGRATGPRRALAAPALVGRARARRGPRMADLSRPPHDADEFRRTPVAHRLPGAGPSARCWPCSSGSAARRGAARSTRHRCSSSAYSRPWRPASIRTCSRRARATRSG
jgi:hypothetical protein